MVLTMLLTLRLRRTPATAATTPTDAATMPAARRPAPLRVGWASGCAAIDVDDSGGAVGSGGGGDAGGGGRVDAMAILFNALQGQLGVKLESKKATVNMLVVDHVEKSPTEN